jgi:hypothetical protein
VPILEQRDSGRVVAPVLQLLEPGDQQVSAWTPAYVSDDPTHGKGNSVVPGAGGVKGTSALDAAPRPNQEARMNNVLGS